MKRWIMVLVAAVILAGCATYQPIGLKDIKEGSVCLEYKEGMKWEQVTATLGEANFYPKPEPGTGPALSNNARAYKGATVIFFVKPQAQVVDGKKRYVEVVYKVAVCKQK